MYYNWYKIMCINKYRLWDRTQKITWFHILLARNTIFPFFAITRSPATISQQTMVLSCSTRADHILMNFVNIRWHVDSACNRDISRQVAAVFFNCLWNHVSHTELLMVGPGKLMVGHRP